MTNPNGSGHRVAHHLSRLHPTERETLHRVIVDGLLAAAARPYDLRDHVYEGRLRDLENELLFAGRRRTRSELDVKGREKLLGNS